MPKSETLTGKQKRFCESQTESIDNYIYCFKAGVDSYLSQSIEFYDVRENVITYRDLICLQFGLNVQEVCQFAFNFHEINRLLSGHFTHKSHDDLYIIRGNGCLKIGRTSNLKTRLSAIQISIPYKISYLKVFKNRGCYEKKLHWIFDYLRLNGEWFEDHKDINEFILLLSKTG